MTLTCHNNPNFQLSNNFYAAACFGEKSTNVTHLAAGLCFQFYAKDKRVGFITSEQFFIEVELT